MLTIGLGVGASTALFAVVDAVLLRPLPLPEPDRLVRIYDTNPAAGVARTGVASGDGNVVEGLWAGQKAQLRHQDWTITLDTYVRYSGNMDSGNTSV